MLDQESLMRAAECATGFSEWGDAVFREPLVADRKGDPGIADGIQLER